MNLCSLYLQNEQKLGLSLLSETRNFLWIMMVKNQNSGGRILHRWKVNYLQSSRCVIKRSKPVDIAQVSVCLQHLLERTPRPGDALLCPTVRRNRNKALRLRPDGSCAIQDVDIVHKEIFSTHEDADEADVNGFGYKITRDCHLMLLPAIIWVWARRIVAQHRIFIVAMQKILF